ncbi:MAG: nicotinate-nucleotide adenylyltransferase [Burkholderiaceae bacterium]
MTRRRIGLLGGTFDPIHVGHLALARAARDALRLDEVRLIPTGRSWQKGAGGTAAADRLAMTKLASGVDPAFVADDIEVRRGGDSYTIDTLLALRRQLGSDPAFVLILGSDQLRNLASWHRYDELLQHTHIAATQRGGHRLDALPAPVETLLQAHGRQALPDAPAGAIVFFTMPPVPVSGTALRAGLARGDRPAELLPPAVLDYIEQHQLYRADPSAEQSA